MEDDMKKLLSIMLVIVVGLAITAVVAEQSRLAQYGNIYDPETIDTIDVDVSNVTTLLHGWILNETAYIVCTLNDTVIGATGAQNYTVTTIGTYTTGANITWEGLTSTAVYTGTVSYRTRLALAHYTLLGLTPFFWVVFLLGFAVVVVYKKFSPKNHTV